MLSEAQLKKCFLVCQSISSMYLPIYLVRFDSRYNAIYILAGEETEVLIGSNGEIVEI
ncbi:MAG: DUF6888 family protein [Pseudanabaena sp.]